MSTLKYIEIKAPKSIKDLRIKHLKALTNTNYNIKKMSIEDIIEFLSIVTSAKKSELRKINIEDLKKILDHTVKIFSEYQAKDPEEKITILNKNYDLVDPKKVGVGWHIDISNSDLINDPGRLASLMYIEENTNYGDTDLNGNMIYSNKERQELFEKNMSLDTYLNLVGFFLRKSLELI